MQFWARHDGRKDRPKHVERFARINNSWFQTFAMFWMLYAFFWVIPRRLNFICRHFGTLCLFHLHRLSTPIRLWRWNRQSVPKHRHIKFRRQGITQKKTYNIYRYPLASSIYRVVHSNELTGSHRWKYDQRHLPWLWPKEYSNTHYFKKAIKSTCAFHLFMLYLVMLSIALTI